MPTWKKQKPKQMTDITPLAVNVEQAMKLLPS
jgi:hypothetical protein